MDNFYRFREDRVNKDSARRKEIEKEIEFINERLFLVSNDEAIEYVRNITSKFNNYSLDNNHRVKLKAIALSLYCKGETDSKESRLLLFHSVPVGGYWSPKKDLSIEAILDQIYDRKYLSRLESVKVLTQEKREIVFNDSDFSFYFEWALLDKRL